MDFFENPFADFDRFFTDPFEEEESMGSTREPEPTRPAPARETGGHLQPVWDAWGVGSLGRLTRGLGRSFAAAFERAAALSRAPEGEGTRCFCSATSEVRLPNGAREVRHTSRDSRSGRELALHSREVDGRRITERRERDLRTGKEERRRDLLNVEEAGVGAFDRDWAALFAPREEAVPALADSTQGKKEKK